VITIDERIKRAQDAKAVMYWAGEIRIKATPNGRFTIEVWDGEGGFIVEIKDVKIESISTAAYEHIGMIVPVEMREFKWRDIKQKSFMEVIHELYKKVERLKGEGA
jgi:hypothetical protein